MNFTIHRPSILAVALAMALALGPLAVAAQQVQIGGQIRLSTNRLQTGNQAATYELRDNASRLNFRGSADLGDGLRALFGLEMGLEADAGAATNPMYRHSYVGLGGGLGTVALGRLDSANPTGSPLYSQVTAIATFAGNDAGATAIGTSMLNARNRTSNSIGYRSPSLAGAEVMVRGYMRGAGTAAEPEDAARSLDLGVLYRSGPLAAGLGFAKDERSGGLRANEFDDKWQAGLRVNLGGFSPYVLLGRDRHANTATTRRKVNFGMVGVDYRQGPNVLVLNLLQRDVQTSRTGERKRWQAAWVYALSKRTELQAFVDNDGVDSSRSDVRVRAIGTGIKHIF